MRIRLNLKDGSTPLLDTVQQHQETLKKSRSWPQHARSTAQLFRIQCLLDWSVHKCPLAFMIVLAHVMVQCWECNEEV